MGKLRNLNYKYTDNCQCIPNKIRQHYALEFPVNKLKPAAFISFQKIYIPTHTEKNRNNKHPHTRYKKLHYAVDNRELPDCRTEKFILRRIGMHIYNGNGEYNFEQPQPQ